jgi:hypothetical protein
VGSANDAALWYGKAAEFRKRARTARWDLLSPTIRRPEERP